MKKNIALITALLSITLLHSQAYIDLETGVLFPGNNNVAIPGNAGTKISLTEDLKTSPNLFYRLQIGYTLNQKHQFRILYAPLKIKSKGSLPNEILFMNTLFAPNNQLESTYKFNSYRLTYFYQFYFSDAFIFGIGLTGKIRDAEITLSNQNQFDKKKNVGFVPLVHLYFNYRFSDTWDIKIEGDALGAKQGRAEDFLMALEYSLNQKTKLKAGYRILEGGSNGSSVYTFALFHYAVVGIKFSL